MNERGLTMHCSELLRASLSLGSLGRFHTHTS